MYEKEIGKDGFPLIGPHEDIELELMLKGLKPMATFSVEPDMDPHYTGEAFEPYVEQGLFVKFTSEALPPVLEKRWYCLKGHEWRGKLAKFLYQQLTSDNLPPIFEPTDLHQIDGFLLGYPEECIERFVKKIAR